MTDHAAALQHVHPAREAFAMNDLLGQQHA
jgi:hypothetical protein